jgi:hypothetical protein
MTNKQKCLNCNELVANNFCSYCGQKVNTNRITFRHFIVHDILHGVWHVEKGILFTIKEALTRPGKAALEYIAGKRIRYYNVFYLILILIGLSTLLNHYYDVLSHHYFNTRLNPEADNVGASFDAFLSQYSKWIIFSFIPLLSVNSFLLFRKKELNFSEHFIIAGMVFLGVMVINVIGEILYFTEFFNYLDVISGVINFLIPLTLLLYVMVNYYKTFSSDYKKINALFRTLLFIVLLLFEITIFFFLLLGFISNWTFSMKLVY